ncbi:MAG: hypothetical protein LIO76_07655 [Clostridiales bacterium]|nr:hypothetical protein [Clostridiales bacterium]
MHPKAKALHPSREKVYVTVNSDTDATGYTQPKTITWADGRTFRIEAVHDFRPAGTVGIDLPGDCYTVVIQGQVKHLFFEQMDSRFRGRHGRWFVEVRGDCGADDAG